ncbi:hypothetical protein K438DRAFT_1996624 [Mycena galopus ATCC 62051]|nr:hypothetical protein K438DRAFT_1996624 [Mycena galopus ATCC 62051]
MYDEVLQNFRHTRLRTDPTHHTALGTYDILETSLDASIAALDNVTAAGFTKAAADLVKSKPTYVAIGDTQVLLADELGL